MAEALQSEGPLLATPVEPLGPPAPAVPGPHSGALHKAVYAVRRWGRWVGHGVATRWRTSLQFRVVVTTILLGLIVVGLLGTYLFRAIGGGLESDRINASQLDARRQTNLVVAAFQGAPATSVDSLTNNAKTILGTFDVPDGSRYVVLTRSVKNTNSRVLGTIASTALRQDIISTSLRQAVSADPTHQHTQVVELDDPTGGSRIPAVLVGSQINLSLVGNYDLYFVYPMRSETLTLQRIARSFLVGGLFLILMVGAVAWVVARQVVVPVRRASVVAERLAAGNLGERMSSRGHDELALLGTSFNAMADGLQTQIHQLEALSRVQQRFVSDVSHELRTPLTTVRMAADLIHDSRGSFEPGISRSAELLHNELDRFEDLLADLLEISRFDAGAADLEADPTDLRQVLDKVLASTASLAEVRGSAVRVVQDGTSVIADVDPRRVERILRNLLVNAVEHGDGRPVTVHLSGNDDAVAVVVEDHGVGLRPGEASLVFNRFWRADPARARTTGGTGLGLAISLEDARLHNGWLQAWRARRRVTLPAHPAAAYGRPDRPLAALPLPLPAEPPAQDDDMTGMPGAHLRRPGTPRAGLGPSLVAALACLAVLAGCGGLPTNTTVQPGLDVNGVNAPPLQYVPPGPARNATPDEILRGFLVAGTASDGVYDVARAFLTNPVARSWVPDGPAVIYDSASPLNVTAVSGTAWQLSATELAVIQPDGKFAPSPPGTVVQATVTLDKVDGQWRVSALPKGFGRWVGQRDLDDLFAPYRVTYLGPPTAPTVPDIRWFPRDHLPNRLATAVIDPLPAYLKDAATTAFPADANLSSVQVRDGVATVDLTGTFRTDTASRREMWSQLVLSLTGLPDVNAVVLQNNGVVLDYAGRPARPLSANDVDPPTVTLNGPVAPVLRVGAKVTPVDAATLLDPGAGGRQPAGQRKVYPDVAPGWVELALSVDGLELAAVDGARSGLSRWRNNQRYVVPVSASDIARPAYDTRGFLWFSGMATTDPAAADPSVRIWVVDTRVAAGDLKAAAAHPLPVPWLDKRIVTSVEPSADGQRVAVVSTDPAGHDPRLEVAGVVRDGSGLPTALATPLQLAPTMTLIRDVAWADDVDVVAIGQIGAKDPLRVITVNLGGQLTSRAPTPGAISIAVLASQRDVVVVTDRQTILVQAGQGWQQRGQGTDLAVAPG
ncbi:MAG: MtrAB system histidine kinase MtrB [Nostocoides sp.]